MFRIKNFPHKSIMWVFVKNFSQKIFSLCFFSSLLCEKFHFVLLSLTCHYHCVNLLSTFQWFHRSQHKDSFFSHKKIKKQKCPCTRHLLRIKSFDGTKKFKVFVFSSQLLEPFRQKAANNVSQEKFKM